MHGAVRRHLLERTFLLPGLIAVTSTLGLVVALLDDGWVDWLGWIALALPLMAIVWAWRRRARSGRRCREHRPGHRVR